MNMNGTESLLSLATTRTVAIVLLTVPFIAYGGTFLLRVVQGGLPTSGLQKSFFRAGHAHAGVLVILGILLRVIVDLAGVTGLAASLSTGVLLAAILMPAGFFLSVLSRDAERPNGLVALIWLGAASLAVGVVSGAVGLLSV